MRYITILQNTISNNIIIHYHHILKQVSYFWKISKYIWSDRIYFIVVLLTTVMWEQHKHIHEVPNIATCCSVKLETSADHISDNWWNCISYLQNGLPRLNIIFISRQEHFVLFICPQKRIILYETERIVIVKY